MTPADFVKKWPDTERRISEHADALMKNHVVAICADRARPRLVGSGFFVAKGSRLYLVSAAHVFAEQDLCSPDDGLFFYTGADSAQSLAGRLYRSNSADVAVLRLDMNEPAWSGPAARKPIAVSDIGDLTGANGEDWFLLCGFPESRSRVDSLTRTLTGRPHGFMKQSAGNDAYEAHGLSPRSHVLLNFDQRKTVNFVGGASARFPDPRGISGAPLWIVRFQSDGQLTSQIVGIAIEHRSKTRYKVIVCTRIEPATEMIELFERENESHSAAPT